MAILTIQKHIEDHAPVELTFAQVGAGGPLSDDFLVPLLMAHPAWRGIFIEPLGRVVEKLEAQYQGKYTIKQCAVSNFTRKAPFYYFATDAAQRLNDMIAGSHYIDQEQLDMFGSCNKEHAAECFRWKNAAGARISHVTEMLMDEGIWLEREIEFDTLGNILDAHDMNPQLLIVDTEGTDLRILRDLDYNKYDLEILVYEHTWAAEESRDEMEEFLQDPERGYEKPSYYKGTGGQRCDEREEADNTLAFR